MYAYTAVVDLFCDNSIYLYRSDDDFTTYEELENGDTGGNMDPAPLSVKYITFNTKLRIGCWNYGGPGYLKATITVDDISYDLADYVNVLYKLVGFEKVDEDESSWVTTPKPDTSDIKSVDNPESLVTPYDVGAFSYDGSYGYWVANMIERKGIIWVDFDFGNVVDPSLDLVAPCMIYSFVYKFYLLF